MTTSFKLKCQNTSFAILYNLIFPWTMKSSINVAQSSGKSQMSGIPISGYTTVYRENLDFPPYFISHGQKIGASQVLLATHSKVANCVCAALQIWSAQCGRNISALEVVQSYSVSFRTLFGKDPTRPNFCSIADGAIIRGGIQSIQILWDTPSYCMQFLLYLIVLSCKYFKVSL